jgi:hypothetical protein
MIVYKGCKLYLSSDKSKKTVTMLDIESETALSDNFTWGSGDDLETNTTKTVITRHEFDYSARVYNIIIPEVGDLKITGVTSIKENIGNWKARKRYKLTLTG